jgi:hypothetical protein
MIRTFQFSAEDLKCFDEDPSGLAAVTAILAAEDALDP